VSLRGEHPYRLARAEIGAAARHLTDLFFALGNPRPVAEMLAGSPRTARLLVSLFGSSDFLSRNLVKHPELIDQLLGRGAAPLVRKRDDFDEQLARQAQKAGARLYERCTVGAPILDDRTGRITGVRAKLGEGPAR